VKAYQHFPDEWPFPYFARHIFELNGPSLTVTLQITNSGKTEMPAGMGMHTYFVRTPLTIVTVKTEKM
jgi:aldose 1-epimerase